MSAKDDPNQCRIKVAGEELVELKRPRIGYRAAVEMAIPPSGQQGEARGGKEVTLGAYSRQR